MNQFNYKKNRGFSLVETLIAVSILMVAITGPLALVQAGLFSSNHERNEITATYLAQEAIEYIRSIRDANSYKAIIYKNVTWMDGPDSGGVTLLTLCKKSSGGCYVDPQGTLSSGNKHIEIVGGGSVNAMRLETVKVDGSNVLVYDYSSSGKPTTFTRVVNISPVSSGNDDNEVVVTVTVTWSDNGVSRNYIVSENLLNYEKLQ